MRGTEKRVAMREMSHGRCVQRVCCPSWSCTPHAGSCPSIDGWARPTPLVLGSAAAGTLGAFPLASKLDADRERRRP